MAAIGHTAAPRGPDNCGDRNAELVIMRARSARDKVRLPEVKSGLWRSLMTTDHTSR